MLAHLSFERQSFTRLISYLVSDAFRPTPKPGDVLGADFFLHSLRVQNVVFSKAPSTRTFYVNAIDAAGAVGPIPNMRGNGYVPIYMRLDVDLGIIFETEMEAANFGPGKPVPLQIRDAYFLIYLDVDPKGSPILNVIPDKLPDLPISDEQREAIRQALTVRNALPFESSFVPLRDGAPSRVVNAGISFSADNNIVIRLEFEPLPGEDYNPSDRLGKWTRFFAKGQPSNLGGRQWAAEIETGPMMGVVRKLAEENMKSSEKFVFTRSPWVSWLTGQPAFRLDTEGFIPNACGGNDIRVKLWVTARLSVPSRNVVRVNMSLGYSKDTWDVIKCLTLSVLFWPIVGFVTFIDNKAPWWAFGAYFIVLAVPALVPALYIFGRVTGLEETLLSKALSGEVNGALKDGPELHQVDEFEYYVDIPIPRRDPLLRDWVALDEISASGDSLIFRGALLVPAPVMPRLVGKLVRGFESWWLARPCANAYERKTVAEIDLKVVGDVAPRPNVVLKGTDPAFHGRYWIRYEIVDDLSGVYSGNATRFDYTNVPGRLKVTVKNPPVSSGFRTEPYPLKLRFLTSGGAKLFTIDAPPPWPEPPADPDEARRQDIAYGAWRINNCLWKQNLFTMVKALQVFWLPTPRPDQAVAQHWLVRVAGLAADDRITAWDGETGRQLATVRPAAGGETELSLVLPSERATGSLMLTLNDQPFLSAEEYAARAAEVGDSELDAPLSDAGPISIDSVQTPLTPIGTIEFDADVERLALAEELGTLTLTAESSEGLQQVYAWSAGSPPVLMSRRRAEVAPMALTVRASGLGQAIGAFDRRSGTFRVWAGDPDSSPGDSSAKSAASILAEYVERPWFAGGARVGDTFVQVNDGLRSATVYHREQSVEAGISAADWSDSGSI